MATEVGRVTRISVIMAVVVAFVMVASPVLQIGGKSVGPVGNAAATAGDRDFNVGVVGMTGSVSTLNPFSYTMSAEFDLFEPTYSYLLTYDQNANRIGDLATSWSLAPDGLTWHFTLANNAYWCDPAAPTGKTHQLTAADVMFTYWECNNDSANHLASYFLTGNVGILNNMWTGTNQFDLYIQTKTPYAPLLGALTSIPIVPKYVWGSLVPGKTMESFKNIPCVGSGAFYCTVTGLPLSNLAVLNPNPNWFQIANKGFQVHIAHLNFKSETSDTGAWTDLTMDPPAIDCYVSVLPSLYVKNMVNTTTPGVIGWAQSTGFMFEYELNQLSTATRNQLNMHGSNNQLLLNPTIKLAMAMCVDKQTFINDVDMGLGTVGTSLVPDCNPWYLNIPSADQVRYDPVAARALLMAAGWAYDASDHPATSTTCPLYRGGGSNGTAYQPLKFRMLTLTNEPYWATGSQDLTKWAALGGVELDVSPVSTSAANSAWYAGNYDTWLWDWVFSPTSDPSTDCMQVDTSMAIGTWSGSYWQNSSFDALYNRSLVAMDPTARRTLTDEMQLSIYNDHNDIIIAYNKFCYAVNTKNWYGPSLGDWSKQWTLMPDQGYPWLYLQLSPTDNLAPTVTVPSSFPPGYVSTPFSVFGSATDVSGLMYQWYWGDGSVSGWQSSASQTHTYAVDGIYTAYLAAQEQGTSDGFITSAPTTIEITNPSITAPAISSVTATPSTGVMMGMNVMFNCVASSSTGQQMSYNWNFGDGYTDIGHTVNHTYLTGNPSGFTATVSVDDGHVGGGRPVNGTTTVVVGIIHKPSVSIQNYQTVQTKVAAWFNATGVDLDGKALRYTWAWGDGSTTVTTSPKNVTHTYPHNGQLVLTVYADDLTGVPGHNVSAICNVLSVGNPSPPKSLTLVASKSAIWAGQSVVFNASAVSQIGATMRFTISCGDGGYIVANPPAGGNNKVVNVTGVYTFWSPGTWTQYLYVTDFQSNTTIGTPISIVVTVNHPPQIVIPPAKKANWLGNSTSFTVTASDLEETTLKYTWDYGDGSALAIGQTKTHTYAKPGMYTATVYVDDLTGLSGHNVSSSATISIAFSISLKVGWNFVSLPLVGHGYKASNLSLASGDVVSSWNVTTQRYDHTYIVGISPPISNFNILPNTGYWVYVKVVKTLHLYGSAPTDQQQRAIIISQASFVALGLVTLNATWHARDIAAMYLGTGKLTMIAYYNVTQGKFITWLSAIPSVNNFQLVPGQGYWCWVTGGGDFIYTP